jgi:S1-C subfamily serine protease
MTPAPVVAPMALPAGAEFKPLQLARVVMKLPRSAKIGMIRGGLLCLDRESLTMSGGTADISDSGFDDAFRQEFRAANVTVVGNPDALFEDPADAGAELLVGALITGLHANVCFPGKRIMPDEIADASISVTWQAYSTLDRTVVFETATAGSAKSDISFEDAVYGAFANATRALLADRKFRALIVEEEGSPATMVATARFARVGVPAEPLLGGTVRTNMTRIRKSVVTVFSPLGQGSGFFVDASGRVLTNAHVVGGAERVKLRVADGRELPARVLSTDRQRDVALLKIEEPAPAFLPVGTAAGMVGGDVYAVGSPLQAQLEATVSKGILSSERVFEGQRFLQSDVNVQHGSSGGPLLDEHGNVIGITVSGLDTRGVAAGINFFIPIEDVVSRGGT